MAAQEKAKSGLWGKLWGGPGKDGKDVGAKPTKAKLGQKNAFYYDEQLKCWREPGKDVSTDDITPPPPPSSRASSIADSTTLEDQGTGRNASTGSFGSFGASSAGGFSKANAPKRYVESGFGPKSTASSNPPTAAGFLPIAKPPLVPTGKVQFFVPSVTAATENGNHADAQPAAAAPWMPAQTQAVSKPYGFANLHSAARSRQRGRGFGGEDATPATEDIADAAMAADAASAVGAAPESHAMDTAASTADSWFSHGHAPAESALLSAEADPSQSIPDHSNQQEHRPSIDDSIQTRGLSLDDWGLGSENAGPTSYDFSSQDAPMQNDFDWGMGGTEQPGTFDWGQPDAARSEPAPVPHEGSGQQSNALEQEQQSEAQPAEQTYVQTYGGGYTWEQLLEWGEYYRTSPEYAYTEEQVQEWLSTMQPDPAPDSAQPAEALFSNEAEAASMLADSAVEPGAAMQAESPGTHHEAVADSQMANGLAAPVLTQAPDAVTSNGPSSQLADAHIQEAAAPAQTADSASPAVSHYTEARGVPAWRAASTSSGKLTGPLPWDDLDSDDDASVSSPAFTPAAPALPKEPPSPATPASAKAARVQPDAAIASALRPLTNATNGFRDSVSHAQESFFEPVHAILGLDAAAAISPAEADHPARDAAEFLESSSPAHVPDPSIASSMIAHDGASSTASLQEVQSATLEPPVEALPIVAAAAAAAAAASTPVLSPFTARARTALPSDSDDPVEVDSGDVIETLGDGASTPGGCIPTAQQQVEAALQQELGVAASLEIMQAMQLPTGHEAADANGWDDLMSTEPPPILDGGKKPQAKASSSQPPTPVAGPSSALQPHALAPPVSPQAESPRLSSSRLDDADILALRQQLEALHARCTAMQAEHDAQRNESVQQHEAVTHELAASTATLKHLEAHAAKNDAEIARLSGLLSGANARAEALHQEKQADAEAASVQQRQAQEDLVQAQELAVQHQAELAQAREAAEQRQTELVQAQARAAQHEAELVARADHISSLEESHVGMQEQLSSLQSQLTQQQGQAEQHLQTLEASRAECEELRALHAGRAAEVEQLAGALTDANVQLESASLAPVEPPSSAPAVPAELERLQAQLAELQAQLDDARAENDSMMTESLEKDDEIEQLQGQLSRLKRASQTQEGGDSSSELAGLRAQLSAAQAHVTALTQQLEASQGQVSALVQQLAAGQGQVTALAQQLEASRARVQESEDRAAALSQQLADQPDHMEALAASEAQVAQLTAQALEHAASLADSQERGRQLSEQLLGAQTELASARQDGVLLFEEREGLKHRLEEAQREQVALAAALETSRAEAGQYQSQLMQAQEGALEQQAVAVQLQAAQAERDTQGVQLRKLRSKRAEQAKALDRVGAELAQALEQRRQLQEDAAQAQASLVQRDVQLRDLQQALAAAQLSGEAAGALEARVSELQAEVGEGQSKVAALERDNTAMREQQTLDFERICQLDEETQRLQDLLDEQTEGTGDAAKLGDLQQQLEASQQALAASQQVQAASEAAADEALARAADLERLLALLSQAEATAAEAVARSADLEAQVVYLQQSKAEIEASQQGYAAQLADLQDRLRATAEAATQRDAELEQLRTSTASREASLQQQVEVLQQQHAQEVGALAGEVQQLADSRRATAEALQAEMDSAQGEAAARLEELEAQIQLLQNDNYDVITCITQESDKGEALQQLLLRHGVPNEEIEAVLLQVEESHNYTGDADEGHGSSEDPLPLDDHPKSDPLDGDQESTRESGDGWDSDWGAA